jgi:outer membrane receptor protein involved in Fe transport
LEVRNRTTNRIIDNLCNLRIRAADRPGSLGAIQAKSSVTGDGAIAYLIRSTSISCELTLKFSGFTKADLFASFEKRVSERITAVMFGGADNLFDQKYFENGFRAPGIVGRGGVNFKF